MNIEIRGATENDLQDIHLYAQPETAFSNIQTIQFMWH